ncbi:hypothetical protein ONB66_00330 [Candidatus Vidania fulgoroideae]|uniref:Uncharacterized protein n=1 Tax=Candidatus Vidania fulgoroideorum TaxID=881286 RepID=A0AAX3N8R8_9PROT|nr:hypothetical protein ONB67_00550 [Candidatus Vidania fulgoroideae]WDR79465.1 hypothetical protein ONB66_00330 [Candidatus Vidania fulgoroideae]
MKIFLYSLNFSFISIGNKGKINDIFFFKKKPKIYLMKRAGGNLLHTINQIFIETKIKKKYFYFKNIFKIEIFFFNFFFFYFGIKIKKKGNNLGFFLHKNFEMLKFFFTSISSKKIYFVINIIKNKISIIKSDTIIKYCNFNKITTYFSI